ncbi:hypothetical protein ACWEQG_38875 [Microbispora sp. NPDC004025]
MGELVLTAERREELAALLDDVRRLDVEYPKVAEYVDTALKLTGTGDPRVDGAFDLRLVHYMTGGKAGSGNPYWEIVAPAVFEHEGRRLVNGGRSEGSARLAFAQIVLQSAYAYAVPSPETIAWMGEFCANSPVIELGAGRGYWAAQLSNAGLLVDAYDSDPPDKAENASFPRASGQADVWHSVGDLDGFNARIRDGSGGVLFLCWPPGWGVTMASDALASFEEAGGERLVFVGQEQGGQTGDDAFFEALSTRWKLESVAPDHVSWWTSVDVAQGWVRS